MIFNVYATTFGQFMADFQFFYLDRGSRSLYAGLSEMFQTYAEPSEKFLIVEHLPE